MSHKKTTRGWSGTAKALKNKAYFRLALFRGQEDIRAKTFTLNPKTSPKLDLKMWITLFRSRTLKKKIIFYLPGLFFI
jgi:hypothetical protein